MNDMKCGGVIDDTTTKADLLARGFKDAAADEVLAFRERLGISSRARRIRIMSDQARLLQQFPSTIQSEQHVQSMLDPDGSWKEHA